MLVLYLALLGLGRHFLHLLDLCLLSFSEIQNHVHYITVNILFLEGCLSPLHLAVFLVFYLV